MYLVYKTDNHHSYASRDLIGCCSTETSAICICGEQAMKEGQEIDKDQLFNLQSIRQTQGYSGHGEFDIEIVDEDVLL